MILRSLLIVATPYSQPQSIAHLLNKAPSQNSLQYMYIPPSYYSQQQSITQLLKEGSLKIHVSFAKEPYKRDDILQRRRVLIRSLLIIATPYNSQQQSITQLLNKAPPQNSLQYMYINTYLYIYIYVYIHVCIYLYTPNSGTKPHHRTHYNHAQHTL